MIMMIILITVITILINIHSRTSTFARTYLQCADACNPYLYQRYRTFT